VIEAYERVFEDKEYYYSNRFYIRFLEIIYRNPKARPLAPNNYYIKTKVLEYYKDRDFSYLVINYWGKIKVKTLYISLKLKV